MELHDLPNLKLPPLKYTKKLDRQLIENDPKVQNLIRSNLLLDKELISLLYTIKDLTNEINKILEESRRSRQRFKKLDKKDILYFPFIFERRHLRIQLFKLIRKLRHATKEQRKEIEKELQTMIMNEFKKHNNALKRKLKEQSNKIINLLDSFEKKKNIQLDITISLPVYFCPKCNSLICTERFHSTECVCGEKISSVDKVKTITIHLFNKNVISFIEKDLWLEHGIDYLFRKKNFQTICGVYVLGHSGVQHEIDNIVENVKENMRIFCECKNRDITVADVFIFSGKMLDIGCSRGYIFTTSLEIKKEIKQLARSKNISIIDSVLKKSEKELIREIKE